MGELVRLWIDRRAQPILLSIEPDHRLVQRSVIRAGIGGGL